MKQKQQKKLAPTVGNEIINRADVLGEASRRKGDFSFLLHLSERAENLWRGGNKNGYSKYIFRSAVAAILLFTGFISWFSLHAEVAKFYPSSCLGGWQNTKNAEGEPELSSDANAPEFNDTNSAVLSDAASQIFCGSFVGEIPQNAEMKTLLVKLSWSLGGETPKLEDLAKDLKTSSSDIPGDFATSTDAILAVSSASSTVIVNLGDAVASSTQEILDAPANTAAEIHLEDTPPLLPPPPTETPAMEGTSDQQNDRTMEQPNDGTPAPISFFKKFFSSAFAEEVANISDTAVTSTPETTIEQSNNGTTTDEVSENSISIKDDSATITDEESSTTTEPTSDQLPVTSGQISSPEFLEVLYTLDGAEWQSLGRVSKTDWKSEFKIPVSAWADISKLQVSIHSLPSIDTLPKVYLDGMWLLAEYENLTPEKAPEKGSGTISSVANVEAPTSFLATETVNGAENYVLTLDNPGLAPDYKYQFINKGVRLLSKHGAEWKELMSGVEPIPEYGESRIKSQESGTTTEKWEQYPLVVLPASGAYSGWREDTSNGGRRMIREFETTENGTPEIFTEIWEIPESAEALGNKGPKATYKMTKNNATSSLPWRLRLAYNGIKEIKKENDNIKDEDNYPILNRMYGDFSINLRDFDEMEAKDGKSRHRFSEKDGGAEAIFFPDGTDGERIVDPTMVTAGIATGWGHNKTRAVFYTGARFWLLYTDATGKIYYKSSTDNSTWTATTTLITNMSTTNVDFDTFLVDNTKFDLGYPDASEDPLAVTVTVSGSTLATSTASAPGAATTCNSISLARTPSANRTFLACRNGTGLEVYSANQTGDANSISTWTTEIGGATETELVNQVTMAPYGDTDKVLVLYEKDGATDANDCIWSRAIARSGGAGTAVRVNCNAGTQFASDVFGNIARTASSTFSFVYHDTIATAGLREAVWNDSSWATSTVVASGAGIKSPSLFYDNVTSDLYAFASTTAGVVYYKKTAGSWGGAITADNSEGSARQNSFPVTQMQMAFLAEQTFLTWAYRTTNGGNFDLKVGTLGLHGTTTQRAYFFLNDDGGNVDSYTKSHGVTATSSSVSNVKIGERLIARIQVDNITAGTSTKMYRLQWENNTDAANVWNDLSTTTAIRWSLSEKGALKGRPGEAPLATAQLGAAGACVTAGTTYQPGRFVAGNATSSVISLGPNKCTELAFAIETSGATANKTYRLRLVNGASGLPFDQAPQNGAYTVFPTFSIESARTLTYSKEARGAYATSTLDTGGGNTVGRYASAVIGTDGFPAVSYRDTSAADLKFAKCNNISCSSVTVSAIDSAGDVGEYTSIAIGSDGFPVIAYRRITGNDLGFAKCNNISCSSAATSTIDSSGDTGWFTSIAIGTDGFPVVAYYASTTGDLNFAKCNNASCSSVATSTLDLAGDVGQYTSLAIGADGFPVIAYQDTTVGVLKFTKCNNITCSSAVNRVIDAADVTGTHISLAIGTDGFPVVSYYRTTGSDLIFTKCNDIFCFSVTKTNLDTGGTDDVGKYTSLAIGTDGFPGIAYRNSTFGYLNFAKCNNISCSSVATSTLDSTSSGGQYTSLAIGTDGFPIIFHHRITGGDLGFVKCTSIDCATASSNTANLPNNASNFDTFLDDAGYNNVATSDNLYDSLSAATSSRLAFNFKKATSSNTDQIEVTWSGQVSASISTSLQIFNNTSGAWETLETNPSPTPNDDFTLGGNIAGGTQYFDGSNIVAVRAVTGTTTQATTLKTDHIVITFSPAVSLTFLATTDSFGSLTPGIFKIATTTLSVTTNGLNGYSVSMYGNNQGSGSASTTLYLSPNTYTTNIADQTEWVPGAATTLAGNAVVRGSLDSAGQVLAFRVMSASGSAPFRSTAWWGASDADGTAKWAGVASSTVARQIGNSSFAAPSGALNTVQYYLDVPTAQQAGNYTGDITFTAVTNP